MEPLLLSPTKEMLRSYPKINLGLTFDEVLLVPQYSDIQSRGEISLQTKFSRNITLNIPLVSSPMDTVTEYSMAVEMARNGGIGIIHRFMSIEEQSQMVERVKRAESYFLERPYIIGENETLKDVLKKRDELNVNTFLVVEDTRGHIVCTYEPGSAENYLLKGIITNRDFKMAVEVKKDYNIKAKDFMTPRSKLIVATEKDPDDMNYVRDLMVNNKIEKVPRLSSKDEIMQIICLKDINRFKERPLANLDSKGKLRVGAAIGAKDDYLERAKSLIDHGCDVLIVDIANGHSQVCIDAVKALKEKYPNTDVVAGSIATADGAEKLIQAGADGIRCGIGNGSICITRLVAGAGYPQFSALLDVAPVCRKYGVPLISDGGNRNSGNMCKALAAGADCIMLGRLIAGTDESPGRIFLNEGRLVKIYRGMAGYGANLAKAQRVKADEPVTNKYTAEGVEGYIPYCGPLRDILYQFYSGIRSGMSYCGARTLDELNLKARFVRISSSGIHESGVHDIKKISQIQFVHELSVMKFTVKIMNFKVIQEVRSLRCFSRSSSYFIHRSSFVLRSSRSFDSS
eukprot:TRINITY_DN10948_c0_g1_i10.p1 TRINITY_DN10948_c0_g1~~TRINITY_DN10948_c0_g1_i10.p1  ORF type:complete len:571 (+),score=106.81 TRINITY_DN10948_c0_g1_i10:181-1893(+)